MASLEAVKQIKDELPRKHRWVLALLCDGMSAAQIRRLSTKGQWRGTQSELDFFRRYFKRRGIVITTLKDIPKAYCDAAEQDLLYTIPRAGRKAVDDVHG